MDCMPAVPGTRLPPEVAAGILAGRLPAVGRRSSADISDVLRGPGFSRIEWTLRQPSSQILPEIDHVRVPTECAAPPKLRPGTAVIRKRGAPKKRLLSAAASRSLRSLEQNLSLYGGAEGTGWGHCARNPALLPDWETRANNDVHVVNRRAEWVREAKANELNKRLEAVVVIQSFWRRGLAVLYVRWRRFTRGVAASMLQRVYRGHLGRRYWQAVMLVREFAVIRIQAICRRVLTQKVVRRKVERYTRSVGMIARCYRGYQIRKACKKMLRQGRAAIEYRHAAAKIIQKNLRMRRERKRFLAIRWTFIKMQYAIRLRRKTRLRRARRYLRMVLTQHWYKLMKHRKHMSARRIQKTWSLYTCRKELSTWHQAAYKVQSAMRGKWALRITRRKLKRRRFDAVVIQMWWRRKYIWIRALKRRRNRAACMIQCNWRYSWCRKGFVRLRNGAIVVQGLYRRHKACNSAAAMRSQVGAEIKALQKNQNETALTAMRIMSWGCWGPMEYEILRIMRLFARFKAALRSLFLRYSILAVTDLSRPMRISYFQWRSMAQDLNIFTKDKIRAGVTVEDVFTRPLTEGALDMTKTPTLRGYNELTIPQGVLDTKCRGKETIHLGQFLESLMYAAITKFGRPGDRGERTEQNISGKLGRLLKGHFVEWEHVQEDSVFGDRRYLGNMTTVPEVKAEIQEWDAKLRKVHKSLATKDEETGIRVVNAVGFIKLIQEVKLIGPGLSYAKALEGYVASNHDEVLQYLSELPAVGHFFETIQLEYPEFEESVLHCIVTKELKNAVSASLMTIDFASKKFLARLTEVIHSIVVAGPAVAGKLK